MKITVIILAIVIGLGIAIYAIVTQDISTNQSANTNQNTNTINSGTGGGPIISFLDCKAGEYPVEESYPRKCTTPEGEVFTEDVGNEIAKSELIKITSPRPNDTIVSPTTITGQAVGSWFFEGEFPIFLEDVLGATIAQTNAVAQSDWMTDDFVQFTATLTFDNEASGPGKLYLNKSNPSDNADLDDALIIPVDFGLYAD